MNYKEITEKRRAINLFDPDRNVTNELLSEMIDLAARAPSSFNLQPWNLMVLRDTAAKEKLKALAWDQPKVVEAPVTFIVLADMAGGPPHGGKKLAGNVEQRSHGTGSA